MCIRNIEVVDREGSEPIRVWKVLYDAGLSGDRGVQWYEGWNRVRRRVPYRLNHRTAEGLYVFASRQGARRYAHDGEYVRGGWVLPQDILAIGDMSHADAGRTIVASAVYIGDRPPPKKTWATRYSDVPSMDDTFV